MEPILWWEERGKVIGLVEAWPAASKTNASWPAHQLEAEAGEVVYCREESGNPNGYSLPSPKGYPATSPAAQPVGGPLQAFNVRAPRPGNSEKYNLPTQPTRRESRKEPSLWGSPPFLPKKWGPGRAGFPCRSNGVGTKPQGTPPGSQVPARSNSAEKRPASAGKTPDRI